MQPRLGTYLEDWWRRKAPTLQPRTRVTYEAAMKYLPPSLLSQRIGKVRPRDIEAILLPLSASYRKQLRAVLSGVFEDARRNRICDYNPAKDASTPSALRAVRNAPEPREVDRLTLAAPERYKALILVAGYAGLRLGEALALTPDDIRLDAETIRVSKQYDHVSRIVTTPKSRAGDRTTVFATKIRGALEHQLSEFATPHLVVPSAKGSFISQSNFRNRVWKKLTTLYHYHDLRHTFASILISEGVSLALIASLMGHSDPSITMRTYAHFFQTDVEAARLALAKY